MESPYYNLGLSIAAAAHGVSAQEVMAKKASVETVGNHKEPGYGAIQRLVCKYAASAYEECGQMEKFAYHVFNKLASARPWWPEYDEYYDAAASALGRVHGEIRKEAERAESREIYKSAGVFGNVAGGLAKLSPSVLRTMLAGGAVAGLGTGSLAWLANRGIQHDQPKLEAMRNRIDYYNQLTEEIESELASRGTPATREEVEELVQDII